MTCNPITPDPSRAEENALCEQFQRQCTLATESPPSQFLKNLPLNSFMAFTTVPVELLAVRRVVHVMAYPETCPPPYSSVLKRMTLQNGGRGLGIELFTGAFARTSYCLIGNFATLQGIHWFGSDPLGLFTTAVMKNAILPFSLWSNAAQNSYSLAQTISSISRGCLDPMVHGSFFARNLLSNSSLYPGFLVRDYCYERTNNAKLSTLLGFGTSLSISGILNAFLKPLFTAGDFSRATRFKAACTFPALSAIALRESVSAAFQFAHTSPKKAD